MFERDAFLEQLDGLLGEASRRRGNLVLVRGEAGIGKSTLVAAFAAGRAGRVLRGACDPVAPPRPLAPILDIAEQVGGELLGAVVEGDRHRMFNAFLALLRAEGGPWIAVLEDLQWADEATLDLLRVVGRRVAQLPALVVGTFRDDDVGPDHSLSVALGDIPAASMMSVRLPPLSVAAVGELTSGTTIDPIALHAAAAGNPFFVTEVIAAGGGDLPSTVRDAVWARVRRLSPAALRVMRAASVLGPRCDADVLSVVAGEPGADIDECVARGLLRREGSTIEFRHELSQQAVLELVPGTERTMLHRRALAVLRQRLSTFDLAEVARHAVEAGDADAVLELGPKAGAQAAALGAHRAALAHYESTLRYAARLDWPARALLLAAHAYECYVADDNGRAIASQQEAVACWRDAGDVSAEGSAVSELAQYFWWNGEGERARVTATDAVSLLESVPAGAHLARAYARLAQISMVAGDNIAAIEWGDRALAMAERLGEEPVVVHALNSIGSAQTIMGFEDGWAKLEESLRRAVAADLEEDTARAFNNLIAAARENRRYDLFDRHCTAAVAFATDRDLDLTVRCLIGDVAEAALDRGRWAEAAAQAHTVVDGGRRSGRLQSLMVLGRLAARQGGSDPFEWLDEALELLDPEMFGEGICPMRAARAEAAWLAGDMRRAASEVEVGLAAVDEHTNAWLVGELAFWASRVGLDWDRPGRVSDPYAFYLDGHPAKAAAAWAAIGCPYDEAQALADSDDEADLRRALEIFQSLGASPAASKVTDRLRAMGARRIARGPRATTRANPAGLSNREVEVLALLADGLRNAEIAERLVVSTKTVDHHVSAILAKLGVRSRYDAGQKAIDLGLKAR